MYLYHLLRAGMTPALVIAASAAVCLAAEETQAQGCRSWFERSAYAASRPEPASGYIAATSSMHGCAADNRSYHGTGIDFVIAGERVSLKLRSTDFPDVRDALDEALKIRAHDGISKEDADFALDRLLPALAAIPKASDGEERDRLFARAKSLWKDYLLKATAFVAPDAAPPSNRAEGTAAVAASTAPTRL